jgi:hypothetical protein
MKEAAMGDTFGKNVPMDETERMVVAMALKGMIGSGNVKSIPVFDAVKSVLAKVDLSAQERESIKARNSKLQAPAAPAAAKAQKPLPKVLKGGKK